METEWVTQAYLTENLGLSMRMLSRARDLAILRPVEHWRRGHQGIWYHLPSIWVLMPAIRSLAAAKTYRDMARIMSTPFPTANTTEKNRLSVEIAALFSRLKELQDEATKTIRDLNFAVRSWMVTPWARKDCGVCGGSGSLEGKECFFCKKED